MKGLLTGAAIGAGLMYAFDPRDGKRRRALFLDQLNHLGNCTADGLDKATRDLQNRLRGTVAEMSALVGSERASDDVIAQRVRSKAGRFLRHPAALEVDVSDGCVCLRGPVLRDEHDAIVSAAGWVRGVRHVDDKLEVHDTPDIAALQGEGRRRGAAFGGRANWSPAARLVAGSIGGMLMFNCLAGRSLSGTVGGLVGFGLLARALSNVDAGQALGIKAPHEAADNFAPKQTTSLSVDVHSPREMRDPAARATPWPQPSPQVPPVS